MNANPITKRDFEEEDIERTINISELMVIGYDGESKFPYTRAIEHLTADPDEYDANYNQFEERNAGDIAGFE